MAGPAWLDRPYADFRVLGFLDLARCFVVRMESLFLFDVFEIFAPSLRSGISTICQSPPSFQGPRASQVSPSSPSPVESLIAIAGGGGLTRLTPWATHGQPTTSDNRELDVDLRSLSRVTIFLHGLKVHRARLTTTSRWLSSWSDVH